MLKVSSLFSQILAEIPRRDFEKLVANQWDRTKRKGLQVLDPVRGHALLSSGTGSLRCARYAMVFPAEGSRCTSFPLSSI
jgi:hypothetical protein